jgi:hypothetical protein
LLRQHLAETALRAHLDLGYSVMPGSAFSASGMMRTSWIFLTRDTDVGCGCDLVLAGNMIPDRGAVRPCNYFASLLRRIVFVGKATLRPCFNFTSVRLRAVRCTQPAPRMARDLNRLKRRTARPLLGCLLYHLET